ncbi:unnamed protein product [Dracunculus medinensis]|uniref:Innexin n=1 Tax=Dracunculus medinensis TaxID=318479 RepID=A0A158Q618_DRAME|nr:unnamed protein product [Dracunculus medinensis]
MLTELSKCLANLRATHDEDAADRLNYFYTNFLLLTFAILLSAKQYVGEPLQCWVPAQFKSGWESYVESHCFIENTYFVRLDEKLPDDGKEREKRELIYYQWLPFILIFQAALCYSPRMIWKLMSNQSGMNLSNFMAMAYSTKKIGDRKNFSDLDYSPLVTRLEEHVTLAKGPQYTFWGLGILNDLIYNRHWSISGHFPRVTMCDVTVRELGNFHNWTVQCVLMDFKEVGVASDAQLKEFIDKRLKIDGITILRLMSDNCGDLVVAEITFQLWNLHNTCQNARSSFIRKFLDKLKPRYDDDIIDRCNYLVTNSILLICAVIVAAKQYVGEPLQCWVPAEFKSGWEQYVENYCFVENTYFVAISDDIPEVVETRNDQKIHYYQWVPFILMLQASLFMVPHTIWRMLNWQTGISFF